MHPSTAPYVEFKEVVMKVCGEEVDSVSLVWLTTFWFGVVLLSLIGDSLGFTKLEWFNKSRGKTGHFKFSFVFLCV